MRTYKIILFVLINVMVMSSCYSPKYLSGADTAHENVRGAYIKLNRKGKVTLTGELISIDSNKVVILMNKTDSCRCVEIDDIRRYTLRHARSKDIGYIIPVFSLVSFTHGLAALISMPVNIVTTGILTQAEEG